MKRNNPYINNTFFKQTGLPVELIIEILSKLSVKDAIALMRISKEMKAYIENDEIWKVYGAKSFEDFAIRVQQLPEKYKLQVIKNNYSLPLAEEIVRLLALPGQQRMQKLLTAEKIASLSEINKLSLSFWFAKDPCIIMLCEKLISPEQIVSLSTGQILHLNDRCVIALREKWISPEQLANMSTNHIECLFNNKIGIAVLRERLISPEQVANMSIDRLQCLFDNEIGIAALREKLISPEQIASMSLFHVRYLFHKDIAITTLRGNLFTSEEYAAIPANKVASFIYEKYKQLDMDVENEKSDYPRKF